MFTRLILEASEEAEKERTPMKSEKKVEATHRHNCVTSEDGNKGENKNTSGYEEEDTIDLPLKKQHGKEENKFRSDEDDVDITSNRINEGKEKEEVIVKLPPKKRLSEAELYRQFINSQTIVEKVSEYLFDLFDANLTKDFKKMEAFEKRAVKAFDLDVEEYTFEQERLHQEFCLLFEELVGNFLSKEGYTVEQFYEEAKKTIDENNSTIHNNELLPNAFQKFQPSQKAMAEEVHSVVLAVSNFQLWANEMREIRRNEMELLVSHGYDGCDVNKK